jgi:hypothetical protein
MSTRSFVIVLLVAAAIVAAAVLMHTPGGQGAMRSLRALHGSRD